MEFLYKLDIYRKTPKGQIFNWPRAVHILGISTLSVYYILNPKELFKVNLRYIGYELCASFGLTLAASIPDYFSKGNDDELKDKKIAQQFQKEFEHSFSKLLFVIGEDAFFIPCFLWDGVIFKLMTAAIFGILHYPGKLYSPYACFCKSLNVFAALFIQTSLINHIIAHFLQDYLMIKIMIWTVKQMKDD